LLVTALIITVTTVSYPLILHQNPERIARTSPLADLMRTNLSEDSRFAISAPGLPTLPPNFNAGLGLGSIHTYNSLSSRYYHKLIYELGGDMSTYGRRNASINPDYESVFFWMSNIELMLSDHSLNNGNLIFIDKIENIYLYQVVSRMGCCARIAWPENPPDDHIQNIDPRTMEFLQVSKIEDKGDILVYEMSEDNDSLLILSQKYHRDWKARTLTDKGWIDARAVLVNGVFQGVLLPEGVSKLELHFKPYARYMWIGHLFWLGILLIIVFSIYRQHQHKVVITNQDSQ